MPRGRDKGKGAKDLKHQAEQELPTKKPKGSDEVLRATLKKAYLARAKLFVSALDERGPAKLLAALATVDASRLTWDKRADLGISEVAFEKVTAARVEPHMVFSHPDVLRGKLLDYYRNLAALSKKGLDQTLRGITSRPDKVLAQVQFINGIISSIVEDMAVFDLLLAQAVIPAEIGTEIQGTWVNKIGQGAASRVRGLILKVVDDEQLQQSFRRKVFVAGKKKTQDVVVLRNEWTITFSDEPDVAIHDPKGALKVAIEIKGSMDVAGAQSRYGEAKKSFAKALQKNAQCDH